MTFWEILALAGVMSAILGVFTIIYAFLKRKLLRDIWGDDWKKKKEK